MNTAYISQAQLNWEDHLGRRSLNKSFSSKALIEERRDGFVKWVELRKYNGMGDD